MNNALHMVQEKVTIYMRGMLSIIKIEARAYAYKLRPYAQYTSAVSLHWLRKGERRTRANTYTDGHILILKGWGHPDPAGMWDESTLREGDGVSTMRGRYSSADPRIALDFNSMIDAYIAKGGTEIVADFRKHDPNSPLPCENKCGRNVVSGYDGLCRECWVHKRDEEGAFYR